MNYGFHSTHGLFFQRDEVGNVIVRKVTNNRVIFKVILDPDSWASVVASVSARGDNFSVFNEARELHQK